MVGGIDMYTETMKVTKIEITHSDKTKSVFSGTNKQINDYLEYLQSEDDLLEVQKIGIDYIPIW